MAGVGCAFVIAASAYEVILGVCLLLAFWRLLWERRDVECSQTPGAWLTIPSGAGVGCVEGLSGGCGGGGRGKRGRCWWGGSMGGRGGGWGGRTEMAGGGVRHGVKQQGAAERGRKPETRVGALDRRPGAAA